MKLTQTKIYKMLEATSDSLDGELSTIFQQVNGVDISGGIYLLKINKQYSNINILMSTALNKYPFMHDEYTKCDITIYATKKTNSNIELSLWRKDYLDKLFSFGKSPTGYKDFDNIIAISSSRNIKRHLPTIFADNNLRKQIIEDKYRVFNVSSKDNITTLKMKSGLKMSSSEDIVEEYNRIILFLDGLIGAGIM